MILRSLFLTSLLFATSAFAQTFTTETVVTLKVDLDQPQLDVLFVIDDSGSMAQYQQILAASTGLIIQKLSNYSDVNAAVVTTTIPLNNPAVNNASNPGAGKFAGTGVVNSRDPQFTDALARNVRVGTYGDATEKPLEAIALAFSAENLAGSNKNFLRPNADLMIVVVTDAADQSTLLPADVAAQLKALKGNNAIYLATSFASPTDNACLSETYDASLGNKMGELATLLGGNEFSLCGDMQKNLLSTIPAEKAYTPLSEVALPALPGKVVDFSSITVTADELIPSGDLYTGWVFDSKKSVLVFGAEVDYGSADFLTVTYKMK